MQEYTRKERGFGETEKDLPGSITKITSKFPVRDKLYGALALLGNKNPWRRSITAEDTVWLLDNTAYRNERTGRWEAEFVAAMFSQHTSCTVLDVVTTVAKKIGLEDHDPAYKTLEERLYPFLQSIKPATQLDVLYKGQSRMRLGPSGVNGIASELRALPGGRDGEVVTTSARVPQGANGILEMKTVFADAEGWGIVSDIDDTIKITQTSDPIGILRTTFLDEPQPAPGMPELYKHINSLLRDTSAWFYLSASPYNLYPFLREFRDQHFPHGTIILRDSSWMSVQGLLTTLTLGTEEYKVDRLEKMHSWLPRRKMIFIGDSTQSDPEAYGEIYRRHPEWVKVILIRKVEDIAAIGIEDKNDPERFEKAFKDVPREAWHVFSDPETCREVVEAALTFIHFVPSRSDVPYELIYWGGIPGRGEFIRLALEEGGADYTDTAHTEKGNEQVLAQIKEDNFGDDVNPPPLAPPILRHGDLLISQTPNILLYLAPRLGLVPDAVEDPDALYRVNGLALTALDGLSNEVHDTHHPIASGLYYEDQKDEAVRRSKDFVQNRLPKFLGYFERVLVGKASGDGPWLYGGQLTFADLVLFQCIEGLNFAFPKAILAAQSAGKYINVFKLHKAVQERPKIKAYLDSDRRQPFSMGIYRYYPELDLDQSSLPDSGPNP
ncbi:hypothetical protein GGS20DRAFT_577316 [Poronia punctata]|nr:hypothetical protein GGS20DRAFT_577316 [Poronia punctata]